MAQHAFPLVLAETYARLRKPAAYFLLFITITLGTLFGWRFAVASLLALGVIVLEVLFAVLKELTPKRETSFPNHDAALPAMRRSLQESMEKRRHASSPCVVRYICTSGRKVWPFFKDFLLDRMYEPGPINLKIEIAMMDPEWGGIPDRNRSDRARATESEIADFKQKHSEALTEKKCSIAVYKYSHMPNWHGLLLDGRGLFLSTYLWTRDGDLRSSAQPFELYEASEGPKARERIRLFGGWFDYCVMTHKRQQEKEP